MKLTARLRKHFSTRAIVITAGAVAALGVVGAGTAYATFRGHFGSTITRVAVLTQDTAATYSSSAWTNVGSTSLYARSGYLVDAQFTAESACSGGSGWCSVRILIDGVEADPVVGTDFSFN